MLVEECGVEFEVLRGFSEMDCGIIEVMVLVKHGLVIIPLSTFTTLVGINKPFETFFGGAVLTLDDVP